MKEAAGEANMTVITIVLIGIVLAVGTFIVTKVMNTASTKTSNGEISGSCASGYKLENGQCVLENSQG